MVGKSLRDLTKLLWVLRWSLVWTAVASLLTTQLIPWQHGVNGSADICVTPQTATSNNQTLAANVANDTQIIVLSSLDASSDSATDHQHCSQCTTGGQLTLHTLSLLGFDTPPYTPFQHKPHTVTSGKRYGLPQAQAPPEKPIHIT